MIENGKYYLITTDEWFYSPNGYQCRAVWGKCEILTTEKVFNFTPAKPSTNWFVKCGDMIIAGCQIHYAIECDEKPFIINGVYNNGKRNVPANSIYIASDNE